MTSRDREKASDAEMSDSDRGNSKDRSLVGLALFCCGIFGGAFLIFLVQPMVAKRILPWFGGGPGVWTLCLMFYQSTLFLGYAYAHALVRFARPTGQLVIHGIVLLVSFTLLPVLPGEAWKPGSEADPSIAILSLLLANVALPFLALAATGPLLQAWFARRYPGRSPYGLYAVSNIGSLAALLAFPSLVEPFLPLEATGTYWSTGFLVAGAVILVCGSLALRPQQAVPGEILSEELDPDGSVDGQRFALWLLLPACAVVLLMAVTNKLCLDVASLPFLWVLPLGVYLVSFILCFGSERFYPRSFCVGAAAAGLALQYGVGMFLPSSQTGAPLFNSLPFQIFLFAFILFSLCMLMHGELYRLRPSPSRLTLFYLAVSGGGAVGGLFVGLVAPRVFDGYFELPIGLALAGILMLWVLGRDQESWLHVGGPRWRFSAAAIAAVALIGYVTVQTFQVSPGLLHQERSFFGVLRVNESAPGDPKAMRRSLVHGTTLHGTQFLSDELRKRPTSYFGLATGIGVALMQRPAGRSLNVGIVGLGVGTLAAYGRKSDRFRFYEIDPSVIEIASDGGYFTFISDSMATVEIVQGDARLSLQQELEETGGNAFDVLIVDAFSSDAIPVHLMTRESFDLYFKHLKPGGILAVHVSNRYFDLRPIVYRIGIDMNVDITTLSNAPAGLRVASPAKWIFLSRNESRLRGLRSFTLTRLKKLGLEGEFMSFGVPARAGYEQVPLWTDDYSSLLALIGGANRVK